MAEGPGEGVTFTWWGCASVVLRDRARALAIDPYVHPDGDVDYVCITHADYDHCHEPTLRRLVADPRFERLLCAPACTRMSELDVPHHPEPDDLAFVPAPRLTTLYPKRARSPEPESRGPVELTLDGFAVETIESGEQPQRYKPADGTPWPAVTGRFAGDAFPNLGYLVTHAGSGVTFLHPGDLTDVYDALRELRGRVDYLLFPAVKLVGAELTLVDAVRPRFVVPIHHRTAGAFPLPAPVGVDDVTAASPITGTPVPGAEPDAFRRDVHRLMQAGWYPTPVPPLARVESLRPAFAGLGAELLVVEAGVPTRARPAAT